MSIARMCTTLVAVVLLAAASPVWANGESESSWNPFAKKSEAAKATAAPSPLTAPLQSIDTGIKKLGNGTKKLFLDARNALTPKPSPKPKSRPLHSWIHPPTDDQSQRSHESKPSWFDRLLGRKAEPKKIETMSDWVGQDRP